MSIAVIDVETTGLNPYRHDRIVEVAVVVIQPDGELIRETVTLVNPERDIGPTSIHGLAAADVMAAPRFSDVAGHLIEVLDGCAAIAGHNVRFDRSFLSVEFERLGHSFPDEPALCTMLLAGGGNLPCCCSDFNVSFDGEAHSALHDARATARLLGVLLSDAPDLRSQMLAYPPLRWPAIRNSGTATLCREEARRLQKQPPTYLQRLLTRTGEIDSLDIDDSTSLAYAALLDRVLEDRCVEEYEANTLCEVAERWGLGGERIRAIHRNYLRQIAIAAVADGVVTESEHSELQLVSHLLGVTPESLDEILADAATKISEIARADSARTRSCDGGDLFGKRVCFTGECSCRLDGMGITREIATEMASQKGMQVVTSVTKKLDILVVADPHSQSGKAQKARRYGIRILHEPVFWRELGVQVE